MTELFSFKMCLLNSKKDKSLQQVIEGDILDFVDKLLEVFGSKPCSFHNKQVAWNEKGTSIDGSTVFLKLLSAGQDNSLLYTIDTLRSIKKITEAEELHDRCERGK